jgi:4-carboxymuconolactone decarboxylase
MAQSQANASREAVRNVVPDLINYSEKWLFGEIWERPGLKKRDRSLIVVATLIALGRERQLVGHLNRALDNGVTKQEISEIITHLAFYAGWPAAMTAAAIAKDVSKNGSPSPSAPQPLPASGEGALRRPSCTLPGLSHPLSPHCQIKEVDGRDGPGFTGYWENDMVGFIGLGTMGAIWRRICEGGARPSSTTCAGPRPAPFGGRRGVGRLAGAGGPVPFLTSPRPLEVEEVALGPNSSPG